MGMITTTKDAAKVLQSLDDRANNLPAPGSRWNGQRWVNVCGDCGSPVEGPNTRYRCTKCGKTADQYRPACLHIHDVVETKDAAQQYPATPEAVKAVDAAKAKPLAQRTDTEKALAQATVSAEPKENPKPVAVPK